jgi:hypothetical protein
MDENLDSELPAASAPLSTGAAYQGTEVEGEGESSRAVEKEEDPKTPPVGAGPSSTAVVAVGPRPAAGGRTPLSTEWLFEASYEDG